MPQASVTILAGSSYSFGTMATHRLQLLCRKTYSMSSDVHRLVREYLMVRVGKVCPRTDALLEWLVRVKGLELDFVLSRRIPACIRRKGLADLGANAETETAAEELLEVEFKVDGPRSCSWSIDRWHILVAGSSFTSLLVRLREEFDGRLAGPGARMEAAMEAPTTAAEWRAYVELWLFGPPEPMQATLHRWLRPRA